MNEARADLLSRMLDAAGSTAAELERLRILKEYELGVVVEDQPDPHVRRLDRRADEA